MSNIKVTIDASKDLTTFTVLGFLSIDEIILTVSEYYKEKPTKLVLWDWTLSMTNNVTRDEVQFIVKKVQELTKYRQGGKTALVDPEDSHFGILRMFESYAEVEIPDIKYHVSRNAIEAREWLFSD